MCSSNRKDLQYNGYRVTIEEKKGMISMWLWRKFWSTDIIGKIYILILLFIIIVATVTVVVRYNKSKPTNETINNNVYENKISMISDENLVENKKQESQINNEVADDLNNIKEQKNTEVNNAPTIVAKKEVESKTKENTTSNKKETMNEEQKTQNKEVTKEENSTQPKEEEKKQEKNYSEYEVSIAENEECKNNNHLISTGNLNKWFKTKNEADSYYDSILEKWGKKWESDEISYEEYLEKCPFRI